MIVVSDTSPLNYLVQIECVHVLPALYTRVVTPRMVYAELQASGSRSEVARWASAPPSWLQISEPTTPWERLDLDAGEAAAIALARELRADSLLMDERKGVSIARGMGLVVERTPTVLAIAAQRGLIDLRGAFTKLKSTNFRVPPALLDQLLVEFERREA
ncbi:MAG: DUF3368 domain-containing protein [Phycisphaerae bacterium]